MDSFNRQVCFNELSFLDKDNNENSFLIFSNYAKTIKALKTKGFNGIRYEHGIASLDKENLRSIFDLRNDPNGRTLFNLILTTARNPYLDSDTQAEERYVNEDFEVKVQTYQTLLNHAIKNAQVFLFTGDVASNISRIKNVKSAYPNYELVIYRPESLDISFAILQEESIIVKEIVTYDPMELMTLLGMYYTYYTSKEGEIKELISLYTNGNL